MKVVLLALLFGGIAGGILLLPRAPAAAADLKATPYSDVKPWRYNAPSPALPFPRSRRAQSVWASDACWRACGAHCAWNMAACLGHDAQGHCLKLTDRCDRACQRDCRTWGGPLVPID